MIEGSDGLDELSTWGVNHLTYFGNNNSNLKKHLEIVSYRGNKDKIIKELKGRDKHYNSQYMTLLLSGNYKETIYENIIFENAKMAFIIADKDPKEIMDIIRSGKALKLLNDYKEFSNDSKQAL